MRSKPQLYCIMVVPNWNIWLLSSVMVSVKFFSFIYKCLHRWLFIICVGIRALIVSGYLAQERQQCQGQIKTAVVFRKKRLYINRFQIGSFFIFIGDSFGRLWLLVNGRCLSVPYWRTCNKHFLKSQWTTVYCAKYTAQYISEM